MIYREQGKRLIAIKFSVRGRDLAGAVAEAQEKTKHIFKPPYRAVWCGEFEEMQDAEARLMLIVPAVAGADLHALVYRVPLVARRRGRVATSSPWRSAASGPCT